MSGHEHRHVHLATGQFWWHTHPHTCNGVSDFNRLHHHAPTEHEGQLFGAARIDGDYRTNLHDQGWRE